MDDSEHSKPFDLGGEGRESSLGEEIPEMEDPSISPNPDAPNPLEGTFPTSFDLNISNSRSDNINDVMDTGQNSNPFYNEAQMFASEEPVGAPDPPNIDPEPAFPHDLNLNDPNPMVSNSSVQNPPPSIPQEADVRMHSELPP
jgi:hypothetical protein